MIGAICDFFAANKNKLVDFPAQSPDDAGVRVVRPASGQTLYRSPGFMMKRNSITAIALLAVTTGCFADEAPPEPLDLDEALARQSATDLVDGVASAYDCSMILRTFRGVGTADSPVYMVEVQASGPECDDAMLLLARHGADRNFIFRRWEPAPDIHELEPGQRGD
jgi:hypothetical protein